MPTAATLVIQALKEPLRDRKKVKHVLHDGDISYQDVYNIAKIMRSRSMARKMKGTVLEVIGTAQSVGCTIEGEHPSVIIDEIGEGEREVEVRAFTICSACCGFACSLPSVWEEQIAAQVSRATRVS